MTYGSCTSDNTAGGFDLNYATKSVASKVNDGQLVSNDESALIFTPTLTWSDYTSAIADGVFTTYFFDSAMILGEDLCSQDSNSQAVTLYPNTNADPVFGYPTVTVTQTSTQYRLAL